MLENSKAFVDLKSDDYLNASIEPLFSVLRQRRKHIYAHEDHEQSRQGLGPLEWLAFDAGGQNHHRVSLVRHLGKGATSTVFLAKDGKGQLIAVKVPTESITVAMVEKETGGRTFSREAEIMKALCHPGICGIIDYKSLEDGNSYIAMEWVNGPNLAEYWNDRGTTLRNRLDAFIQTCDAVNYMHKNLYIHGDIRPENILVTHDDDGIKSKLIDFGSSFRVDVMQPQTCRTNEIVHKDLNRCMRIAGLVDSMGLSHLLRTFLEIESEVHDNHNAANRIANQFDSILRTPSFDIGHLAFPSPYTIACKSRLVLQNALQSDDVPDSAT